MVGEPLQGPLSDTQLTSLSARPQKSQSNTWRSSSRYSLAIHIKSDPIIRADMEKEAPESMATINMKPEYAPSEVYSSSEPPPAYHRSQSSSVHIAKIIAVTVVVCSVIMGSFLLASSYVRANASCRHLEQELEFLGEAADRIQGPLQPEALIQEAPLAPKHQAEPLGTDEPPKKTKEIETNDIDDAESSSETSDSSESEESEKEVHLKLPVQMELEDVIGSLLEKNQRSKMNCIVEKKKSEEFVDHQPKTITLPFGLNLTTNPRFEKLSGERMVIICETGTVQRAQPPPQEDDDDNQEEDTIMIQPVMIPIPQTPFHTHMPQQMRPIIQRLPEQMQMRPPMRPPVYQMESMRPPMPSIMQQQMPPMFQQQVPQMMQQQSPRQAPQFPRVQMQIQMQPQMPVQSQVPQMQQNELPPNPILHHIVQQIIAQKIIESQKLREEQMREEQAQAQTQQQQQEQQPQVEVEEELPHRFQVGPQMSQVPSQNMIGQRIPIPEEVLTQLNRLPNRDVIVAVAESDSEEAPQDVRFVQEQRQGATEMNGRQTFARGLPVDIPIAMMPQEQEPQEQEPQAASSEESRPHYVQPRSV